MATGKVYKGHDLPRLRGAMVASDIDAEGLRVFGQEWNANLIRWQLVRLEKFDDPLDLAAYDRWLQSALKKLDTVLPLCEKYGLRVVVDLHSPPGGGRTGGGYAGSDHGLFSDAACQRKFVEVWRHIAQRYKDSKAIWGYDLANEPVESAAGEELADWQDLAQRAAEAIRAIDPQRTIIVEPPDWGNPAGLRELRPLTVPHVVYSVHMYLPHAFTHQGVDGHGKPCRYPGEIDGKRWDKAAAGSGAQAGGRFPAALRRPHLHRRVQRHPLGPGRQRLSLLEGPDRDFRGPRLGLELPCLPRMGRLERGAWQQPRRSSPRGDPHRPREVTEERGLRRIANP